MVRTTSPLVKNTCPFLNAHHVAIFIAQPLAPLVPQSRGCVLGSVMGWYGWKVSSHGGREVCFGAVSAVQHVHTTCRSVRPWAKAFATSDAAYNQYRIQFHLLSLSSHLNRPFYPASSVCPSWFPILTRLCLYGRRLCDRGTKKMKLNRKFTCQQVKCQHTGYETAQERPEK